VATLFDKASTVPRRTDELNVGLMEEHGKEKGLIKEPISRYDKKSRVT
tara:strand:- start:439 stop:582 length:144 start_codon:yes stop_codon:yes gene_type:complete